jgi:hypothetical protein
LIDFFEIVIVAFGGFLHGDSDIIDLIFSVLNGFLVAEESLFILVDDVLGVALQQAYF